MGDAQSLLMVLSSFRFDQLGYAVECNETRPDPGLGGGRRTIPIEQEAVARRKRLFAPHAPYSHTR